MEPHSDERAKTFARHNRPLVTTVVAHSSRNDSNSNSSGGDGGGDSGGGSGDGGWTKKKNAHKKCLPIFVFKRRTPIY